MIKYTEWSEHIRYDLQMIPVMEQNGYKTDFHRVDLLYKRTTPENPPANSVSFFKGNYHVWQVAKGWQTANRVNGKFQDHKMIKRLEEILP